MDRTRRRLILEDIHVEAGGKALLTGVGLTLQAGDSMCVIGGNGAGKSTLLRVAAGLSGFARGRRHLVGAGKKPIVAGIWQGNPGLMPRLTADENFAYLARLFGLSGVKLRARRDELFARLALDEHRAKPAGDLSTGLKMRLGLAMALSADADLLVLDEVSNGLDEVGIDDLLLMLADYRTSGGMILAATHDRRFLPVLGSEVLKLQGGRPVPVPAGARDLRSHTEQFVEDAA